MGLIAFKVLGGRFWALAPSSYTHPGSFARYSIPATERYATASQRTVLERLGRTWGCHTCGSRQFLYNHRKSRGGGSAAAVRFVGDHMPPKSVANQLNSRWYRKWTGWTVRYRFYPQCVPCSNKQGNLLSAAAQELRKHQLHSILFKSRARPLSAAGGGAKAHFHGFRPRIHHCTGGLLAGIATMTSSTTATAEEESRRYYTALQSDAEQWIRTKYKGNVQRHLPWLPSLPPPSRR